MTIKEVQPVNSIVYMHNYYIFSYKVFKPSQFNKNILVNLKQNFGGFDDLQRFCFNFFESFYQISLSIFIKHKTVHFRFRYNKV